MNTEPRFTSAINTQLVDITNSDGTTEETLFTAGSEGSRVDSIYASTDEDTADVELILSIDDGTITMPISNTTIIQGSGTDGTNMSVNLLNNTNLPFINDDGVLYLKSGWTLKVKLVTTITASKTCWIGVQGGDY